jgi:hypothetical protein
MVIDTDCLEDRFIVNVEGPLAEVISSLVPSAKGALTSVPMERHRDPPMNGRL